MPAWLKTALVFLAVLVVYDMIVKEQVSKFTN